MQKFVTHPCTHKTQMFLQPFICLIDSKATCHVQVCWCFWAKIYIVTFFGNFNSLPLPFFTSHLFSVSNVFCRAVAWVKTLQWYLHRALPPVAPMGTVGELSGPAHLVLLLHMCILFSTPMGLTVCQHISSFCAILHQRVSHVLQCETVPHPSPEWSAITGITHTHPTTHSVLCAICSH